MSEMGTRSSSAQVQRDSDWSEKEKNIWNLGDQGISPKMSPSWDHSRDTQPVSGLRTREITAVMSSLKSTE